MKYHIDTDKAVWRNIDGEIVVLNLDSGHYYSLNKTGSVVWSILSESKPLQEAIERIVEKYNIPHKSAEEDVMSLLKMLQKEGLISSVQ